MSDNQVPMPPVWKRLPCLIGIHKREVVFGWNDHLDDPSKSGYYGFAYCLRCGRTLPLTDSPVPEKPTEAK